MAFRVISGTEDITSQASSIQWSSVDPGGFEAASFSLHGDEADAVKKGNFVRISYGADILWEGRISDVQNDIRGGTSQLSVSCQGMGVLLKDTKVSQIYIDRELSNYADMSVTRKIAYLAAGYSPQSISAQSTRDDSGTPGIISTTSGVYNKPIDHRVYDAGVGNKIARVRIGSFGLSNLSTGDTNLAVYVTASDDDIATSYEQSSDQKAATSIDYSPIESRQFIFLEWASSNTAGGTDGTDYGVKWLNISLIGDHGLTLRDGDSGSDGFWASDIARHAALQVQGIFPGEIENADAFVVPHCTYIKPTSPEDIVTDMAQLVGWHTGVWDDTDWMSHKPRFFFKRPPRQATHYISRRRCTELSLAESLNELYNTAIVSYQDAAGVTGQVTVTRNIDILTEAGISRTIDLDLGTGSEGAATVYGKFYLALQERQARANGSATLPDVVQTFESSQEIPAFYLRAGLHRLKITDLPNFGVYTDLSSLNTFRLKRVETTIGDNGVPSTKVEFDAGADLLEVMQARLSLLTGLAT